MANWTAKDIPSQTGRVFVVTGANSGLGYQTTLALTRAGAQVVMASRDAQKGQQALENLKTLVPDSKVEFIQLDLASLESIKTFADQFKKRFDRLDTLVNNAGIMTVPFGKTADGFERQFGTNHLGHFALTGLLLDCLLKTPGSRVVTVSSMMHVFGNINFDDLQGTNKYDRVQAYSRSKIANIYFGFELQRRLKTAGSGTISLVAHPGYAATNLQGNSATLSGSLMEKIFYPIGNTIMAQSAEMGALPQLYAATAPGVKGGEFYGPRFLSRGYPALGKPVTRAYDQEISRRLWEVSEELTGVHYVFEPQSEKTGLPV